MVAWPNPMRVPTGAPCTSPGHFRVRRPEYYRCKKSLAGPARSGTVSCCVHYAALPKHCWSSGNAGLPAKYKTRSGTTRDPA